MEPQSLLWNEYHWVNQMKHEADQYEWKSMECHFNFLPPYITMLQYLDTGTLYGEFVTCLQFSVRQPIKQGTIMDHNRSFTTQ